MHGAVMDFRPHLMVVDPISNLSFDDNVTAVRSTLMRLIDFLKREQVTAVFTDLVSEAAATLAVSQVGISSLMDTWIVLANRESNGERTRALQVVKSRGMAHSNEVREFTLGSTGIELLDVCMMDDQVVTGRARRAQVHRGAP